MKTLPTPPTVLKDRSSIQMIQAWLAKGQVHVSLYIGLWDEHKDCSEEEGWGSFLADIA
jgi:hypothetical protein